MELKELIITALLPFLLPKLDQHGFVSVLVSVSVVYLLFHKEE